MFFQRSNSLQDLKEPQKRHRQVNITRTGKLSRNISLSGSNEIWRIISADSQEEEQRAIDISFSNSFLNPVDIIPSPKKLVTTNAFAATGYFPRSTRTVPDECGDRSQEQPREKKVTFVLEDSNPEKLRLTAQRRRQNFRNSYSKGSGNTSNLSTDVINVNFDSTTSKVSSADAAVLEVESCASPKAVGNQSTTIDTDRPKPQAFIKRKLKSCRSRSFHKSLDSSFVYQNARATFSHRKPLKAVHPEVVTMISLVNSEKTEQNLNLPTDTEVPELVEPGKNDEFHSPVSIKSEAIDQSSTGIIRFTGVNIKAAEFVHLNPEQRRNLFAMSKNLKLLPTKKTFKASSNIETNVPSKTKLSRARYHFEIENLEPKVVSKENQSFEKCAPLQSVKEKECWSSFHKMTKKGLFVSFDTILRGLLTPTEYRLRKDDSDFLTQK